MIEGLREQTLPHDGPSIARSSQPGGPSWRGDAAGQDASRLLDRCQAFVFELWIPGGATTCGCQVEDRPQGIEVRRSAWVLAWVSHITAHLSAPEVADCATAASQDGEAGDVAIFGADIGACVVAS